MSRETRSQVKSRKRDRPVLFDLNRSVAIETKKKKDFVNPVMAESNPNNEGSIRDLSQTINVSSPVTNSLGPVFLQGQAAEAHPTIEPTVRDNVLGNRHLESKIQNLKGEMEQIKKSILELTKSIKEKDMRAPNIRDPSEEPRVPTNTEVVRTMTKENNGISENNSSGTNTTNASLNPLMRRECVQNSQSVPFDPRNNLRISRLGIRFDGSSSGLCVEEFVYRLEYFQKQYGIPWSEIIRDFPLLLTGRAESWYWLFQKTNRFHDWEELKYNLLSQYQSSKSNFERITELVQRRQQPNETIDEFFHVMGQMRAKLVQPLSEYDMIKIMKKNIKDGVARIVYPIPVSSVEQLRIESNEAEKQFLKREPRPFIPPSRTIRQVNEIDVDGRVHASEGLYDQTGEDLAAIQVTRAVNSNLTCWNCQKQGHTFRDCDVTSRALFCYKCGNPGTTTPKCNICQQLNRNRGVESIGGPRPTANPQ